MLFIYNKMASISIWYLCFYCVYLDAFSNRRRCYERLRVKINGESEYIDKSESEKFRALFEKAKREDPEWLDGIFGNSIDILLDQNRDSGVQPTISSEEPQPGKVNDFVLEQQPFLSLGYSVEDWGRLKDPIKDIILEKGVNKLKSGLPAEWQIDSAPRLGRPTTTVSSPRGGDSKGLDPEGNRLRRDLNNSGTKKRNVPIIVDDSDDEDDEDDPSNSFWPGKEEVKDLLLEEGRWRANFMPAFMIPLLKQEAKLRFGIYKNWLSVLEDGIGDGFDAVAESFDEDVDNDDDFNDDDNESVPSGQSFSWRGAGVDTDADGSTSDDRRNAKREAATVNYDDFVASRRPPQAERRREYGDTYDNDSGGSSIESEDNNGSKKKIRLRSSINRGKRDKWDGSSSENRRARDYDDWLRSSIPASLPPPADRVPPSLSPVQSISQQQLQGGTKTKKAKGNIHYSSTGSSGMSDDSWEDLSQVQRIELDRKRVAQQQEQKRKEREERERRASISKNDWFQDSAGRGEGNYPGDGYEVPRSERPSKDDTEFYDSFRSIRGVGRSSGRPGATGSSRDIGVGIGSSGKVAAQFLDLGRMATRESNWEDYSAAEDRSRVRSIRQDDGQRMNDSLGGGSRYEALRVRDYAPVMRPLQSQGTGKDSGDTTGADNSADIVTVTNIRGISAGVDVNEEEEEELQVEHWTEQQQESLKRVWEISAVRKPVPLPPKGSV